MDLSSSSGVKRLIYHAGVYPIGGGVSWKFRSEATTTTTTTTAAMSVSSSTEPNKISGSLRAGKAMTGMGVTGAVKNVFKGLETPKVVKSSSPDGDLVAHPPDRVGTVQFTFHTRSKLDGTGESSSSSSFSSSSGRKAKSKGANLLMLALPHHAKLLKPETMLQGNDNFDLTYRCIKGPMTAVVGDAWSYDEPLPSLGFDGPTASLSGAALSDADGDTVDPGVRETILDSVSNDARLILPSLDENVYGFGKQIARLAQLAHIADSLSVSQSQNATAEEVEDSAFSILEETTRSLHTYLTAFLRDDISDKMVYDANFGGIITMDGLVDTGADFGNGR